MAAIDAAVADELPYWLDLVACDDEPLTFGDASDVESTTRYAVGTLGKLTLVTAPRVHDHDAQWRKLSKKGRVVAFHLSDDHDANCLYIYDDGKQVIKREDGTWSPRHPLERLAKAKPTDHKADFIRKVFARFTGADLEADGLQAIAMTLHAKRDPDEKIGEIVEALARTLAKPLPTPGEWAGLQWSHRRHDIFEGIRRVWAIDPETAKTWVPAILTDLEGWPAKQRVVLRDDFERIVTGKATELDALLAPAWRRLVLDRGGGRRPKFRPNSFARFFAHPIASELEQLDLGHTIYPPEAAELVARSERLANLVYLSFNHTRIGDAGIAALTEATQFGKLQRLDLYACDMTAASLPALSRATFAPQLVALSVGGNGLGVEDTAPLVAMRPKLTVFTERLLDE